MIDLTIVKNILTEIQELVDSLHGVELDESKAVETQKKSLTRTERAQISQDLNLLSQRFEMCAAVAKGEYWFARGENDPLRPERT